MATDGSGVQPSPLTGYRAHPTRVAGLDCLPLRTGTGPDWSMCSPNPVLEASVGSTQKITRGPAFVDSRPMRFWDAQRRSLWTLSGSIRILDSPPSTVERPPVLLGGDRRRASPPRDGSLQGEVVRSPQTRRASFARIAKRAGLSSTGLISYHFDGRQDLNWINTGSPAG